jgi:transposase-like protein
MEKVMNKILEFQRTEHLNCESHERTDSRKGYRNGYKPRNLTTRVGTLTLLVPQIREGNFSTKLFKRYQRSEQALVLSLMEMVVNGVSTRKVTKITEKLCGTSFSKSTVSSLCQQLDPLVNAWKNRPLGDRRFAFVIVDALVLKIRDNGRVRNKSAMIAQGINEEGYREILGLMIGNSETEEGWKEFFRHLNDRGLHGVDYITSDAHQGLVNAARRAFQGATWQRCQCHFKKNILDVCPTELKGEVKERLDGILGAPSKDSARKRLRETITDYETSASKSIQRLEKGFEDVTAVLDLPAKYRKRLRTTNAQERLNEEIRRRERVIRIFPNDASAIRLVGALLMEQHEEWITGRRYLNMDEYWKWRKSQTNKTNTKKESEKVRELRKQ